MPEGQAEDIKLPSSAAAIVAEFPDRGAADPAVEKLARAGFSDDQVSVVAHGAGEVDGRFRPGGLMVTVHPGGRDELVTRILRDAGASDVRTGAVSAVGEVTEIGEEEREEAAPS